MRNLLLILIGTLLLYAASDVSAAWNTSFQVEIYTGGAYVYAQTPYTYTYSDYYYIDYPFRINSYSNYYYFQPGWYQFDPYWSVAPSYTSYYSYYPSNYYYYNNTWTYNPTWIGTYGPSYYGSYYYPPATTVGQHIQPRRVAKCEQATIEATSFSVNTDGKTRVTFEINNFSRRELKIENVSIYIEGDVSTSNISFDKNIRAKGKGKIEFDAVAQENARSNTYSGNVKVNATFADGTFCSSDDLSATFSAVVNGSANPSSTTSSDIYSYNTSQGSTAYRAPKQGWNDATPIFDDAQRTGHFSDNEIEPNYRVINANERRQIQEDSCDGISIGEENITTSIGKTTSKYFTFKNYGSEDFVIDRIDAIGNSNAFAIQASRDSQIVYPAEFGAIRVSVFGEEETNASSAYIKVSGHYRSGLTCTKLSDNFYVSVRDQKEPAPENVELNFIERENLKNGAGFVKFFFENDTDKHVTVRAYTDNGSVSPSFYTFAPRTSGQRAFAVNDARLGANIRIVAETAGNSLITKTLFLESQNTLPQDVNGQAAPSANNGGGLLGFTILGNGAAILGLIIIALIVAFMFYRQQQ